MGQVRAAAVTKPSIAAKMESVPISKLKGKAVSRLFATYLGVVSLSCFMAINKYRRREGYRALARYGVTVTQDLDTGFVRCCSLRSGSWGNWRVPRCALVLAMGYTRGRVLVVVLAFNWLLRSSVNYRLSFETPQVSKKGKIF